MDFQVLISIMFQLFLVLVLGYCLGKFGIIDDSAVVKLSSLVAKVTCPLLVFSSVLKSSTEKRFEILITIILGFGMYILFIIFAKITTKILKYPEKLRPLYENMLIFSNNLFMGFPVVQSILGTEAIFYTAMLHFAFSVFVYSYGVMMTKKCKAVQPLLISDNDFKSVSSLENLKGFDYKMLLNPGFVISLISLLTYLLGIREKGVIFKTTFMIGDMTTPLSMMVLGYSLTKYNIAEILMNWGNYFFCSIRLIAIPIISFIFCKILRVSDFYTIIVTITNGMPVASMILMLANEYGVDTEVVVNNTILSTILSTITIPIIGGILL